MKEKNSIHWLRDNCRLCLSKDQIKVVNLKPVPVGEKYSSSKEMVLSAPRFPIDLYYCKSCKAVQILDNIDPEFLWSDYTYLSSQTKGIIDHFEWFAQDFLQNYKLNPKSLVVDIGSNDGTLLSNFKNAGMQVLGVDPSDVAANEANMNEIPTVVSLFTLEIAKKIKAKRGTASLITAFNVFAHTDNMRDMLAGIEHLLDENGVFSFEIQYLVDIIDKKILGTIFHEHMLHHSLTSLNIFLNSFNLKLINAIRVNIQKGSIICYAVKLSSPLQVSEIIQELLRIEKEGKYCEIEGLKKFEEFIQSEYQKGKELAEQLKTNKKKVVAYGAARSGPTLAIQLGLENLFEYILDDHPLKVNKFSPFETLQVLPTKELYNRKPDVCFILAWIHTKQIIKNNIKYLEDGGQFVQLWPEIKVIDNRNYAEHV